MVENILRSKFIKSKDGNHFYMKRNEDWLHVVIHRKDGECIQEFENVKVYSEYKRGEALVNSIYNLNPDKDHIPSTEQEFREAMLEAIFNLDIFQYAVTKD
jgi:hypothetical protein